MRKLLFFFISSLFLSCRNQDIVEPISLLDEIGENIPPITGDQNQLAGTDFLPSLFVQKNKLSLPVSSF